MQLFPAQFHTLDRWDAKAARVALHRSTHPDFRPMGEFIEEVAELIGPWEEPDKEWPVYGVDNVNGVFFSHRQLGSKFRQKYKRIRKGWFFHNPTRSAVGSLGMVPEVPDDAITSPEYQVWRVTSGFLPEFLAIMIRTEAFKRLIRIHRVGAVKERLFVRNLREITVPLPPLTEQRRLAQRYVAVIAQVEVAKTNGIAKTDVAWKRVLGDLGLPQELAASTRGRVFPANWREVQRWGVPFCRSNLYSVTQALSAGRYPAVNVGSILEFVQYGSSAKANSHGLGVPIIRMNNIVDGMLDLSDLKHVELNKRECESLLLRKGDILFNRTNSKELVGKCAIFLAEGDYVFASYLVRLRVSASATIPDYLVYLINSPICRRQIDALSRQIIGQANINTEELRSLLIPLPPLSVQHGVVREMNECRKAIALEKEAAERRLKEVESEVQAPLLGMD
jgi:type I restriction enzyme S subunit